MKLKEYNLFDFCKRHNLKGDYTPEMYDKEGNPISFHGQASIITHYLHLKGTIFERTYKEKAERLMPIWTKMVERDYGCKFKVC